MEKDDFLKDDFLRELIRQSPLDSPSDGFTDRVMAGINPLPETVPAQKSFSMYLKTLFPYLFLLLFVCLVYFTSDLPLLNWIPGKNYYLNSLLPYLGTLVAGMKTAFSSKYVSFGLMILAATGLLFLVDQYFSRKTTV